MQGCGPTSSAGKSKGFVDLSPGSDPTCKVALARLYLLLTMKTINRTTAVIIMATIIKPPAPIPTSILEIRCLCPLEDFPTES